MEQIVTDESFLDIRKKTSRYHFDTTKHDEPGEWFQMLGRFTGDWQSELDQVVASSNKINWENIAATHNASISPERLARIKSQELDIMRGGGNPKMTLVQADTDVARFPVFARMVDYFALERATPRLHVQMTGQVFNYHIDGYPHYADVDSATVIRIIVCLEDWAPGHFYMYGTCNYTHWRAGDFHTFAWQDVPHCTANASLQPRSSLLITGIKTPRTQQVLEKYTEFSV